MPCRTSYQCYRYPGLLAGGTFAFAENNINTQKTQKETTVSMFFYEHEKSSFQGYFY